MGSVASSKLLMEMEVLQPFLTFHTRMT